MSQVYFKVIDVASSLVKAFSLTDISMSAWCPISFPCLCSRFTPAIDYQVPIILPWEKTGTYAARLCPPFYITSKVFLPGLLRVDCESTILFEEHKDLLWNGSLRIGVEFLYDSPVPVLFFLEYKLPVALQSHLIPLIRMVDAFITTVKHSWTRFPEKLLGTREKFPVVRLWWPNYLFGWAAINHEVTIF